MATDTFTDADRIAELDRGMSQIELGLSDTITCPWCWRMSGKNEPDCCATFEFSRIERAKKQMADIVKQHQLVMKGLAGWISCPWCKRQNFPFSPDQHPSEWKRPTLSPFCCDPFQAAMQAIVQRMISDELIARKKRIEDGIDRAANN